MSGDARFTWDYDDGRAHLLALYQKGKDKQWDATSRIDWSVDVDPANALGTPDTTVPIYGSRQWEKLGDRDRRELRQHLTAWQFSQFLHGEQGAMICSARIVESVPDLDAKFYAATQTMDEARHAETYARFLRDKVQLTYPVDPYLQALLNDTLTDSRWDFPYLGMQVLIEGLALAAFGHLRDMATQPLPLQILAYVMQDEARHVAFGRMALRDYYRELTDAERAEREEFVVEACYLMRDRFLGREVYETLCYDVDECLSFVERSPSMQEFRALLFTRIVPCVRDIGLWGERVRGAYADMGVLAMAGTDLDAMMRADEGVAEELDLRRFRAEETARAAEVDAVVASGAEG
ncbi:MAG TPA: ferritin-like domain-containing protein [Mycobacteriales bacterium]|nr:ferritin-like domain-containing protein [Mycobacteriales bacterium]